MYLFLVTSIVITCSIYVWLRNGHKKSEKILGIYNQPGQWYYLKYLTFLLLLKIRRALSVPGNEEKCKQMEKQQQLSEHNEAVDAVFFQAVTQDGYYLAAGTERRHAGKITGLFYLATPDYGLLMSEKLPDTRLKADAESLYSMKEYAAEGIKFTPVTPMKTWKLEYNGKMRIQKQPDRLIDVKLEAEWTANSRYFLFDEEMDEAALARAIAREEWSKEYFENLKKAHQTHYEQMGDLKGTLKIENKIRDLEMDAFRDHSHAFKRDWNLMHRYIFHMLYLKDGFRASVGVVSQPCTSSHLEMGYVTTPDRKNYPISSCDIVLYRIGEGGTPPKKYAFTFVANGVEYVTDVDVEYENEHFVGSNLEARMVERFVKYKCNGVEGRGVSEWNYSTACKVK